MKNSITQIVQQASAEAIAADQLADQAVMALIDEAQLTPKPGLVDLRGSGAHSDLDIGLMRRSALALRPTFAAMALAGFNSSKYNLSDHVDQSRRLRNEIGLLGRRGEAEMMRVTGGVNTHRGAIWAMGLLVTAVAQDPGSVAPIQVAQRAGALARIVDQYAAPVTGNKGALACLQYEVGGARGQAQADFPHVIHCALPELHRSRQVGDSETAARLNALLAVMGELDDTCVLSRGGVVALQIVQAGAARVLMLGGVAQPDGRQALNEFDVLLSALKLSSGGAADLLAAALFLDQVASLGGLIYYELNTREI